VQRAAAGEVEFGAVVDEEDIAGVLAQALEGELTMGRENGVMGDGGRVHEIITPLEGVGVGELLGEGATGMGVEAVGEIDQGAGAAAVAEPGVAEMELSPGGS
jgi:hypothetical protein